MDDTGRGETDLHLLPDGEEEEQPDPRVKDELENLNQTSVEVNRLENELDEARAKYRMTFTEASHKMALISKDKKKSIQKAREYYELREEAKKVQSESLKSARQYQSAIGIYRAAKETVALAEERLLQGGEVQLTSAWQEMLNHATIRVMEAEREKRMSEEKHQKTTSRWRDLENRIQELERKFKRAISNARGYFEMKQQLDLRLQQQKQNVLDLQQAIKGYKVKYAESLRTLEQISESIHESRRQNLILMFPRQPGVGAESANVSPCISELSLEKCEDKQMWMSDDETFDDDDLADSSHKTSVHSADYFVSPDVVSELNTGSNDVTKTGSKLRPSDDEVRINNRIANPPDGTRQLDEKSINVQVEPECKNRQAKHESERESSVDEEARDVESSSENIRRLSVCDGNDTNETTKNSNESRDYDDKGQKVLQVDNRTGYDSHEPSGSGTPMLELNTKYLETNY
ncbi:SH3 domain-binding protein 5-like [Pecten maximus]|uniref:SH3 domain-binding protein 5-like n=1 Tax=Pecten maximus TaxID=6579 RepID=UPI00145900CA|nr:SH3 domain-binding protein 5-like [Pecten maximus]